MTRELRHNISMFAVGAIILTAAALAEPDTREEDRARTTVAEQQAEPERTAGIELGGSTAGH